MENRSDQNGDVLKLEHSLGYAAASDLRGQLLSQRMSNIAIDASDVEHLGAPCLQVLLSAQSTWCEDGFAFEISRMSEAFTQCLQRMGFPPSKFDQ